MHALDEILNQWREEAARASFSRRRDMGTAFEGLCAAFLRHDPVQAAQYGTVQTYGEWAQERGPSPAPGLHVSPASMPFGPAMGYAAWHGNRHC